MSNHLIVIAAMCSLSHAAIAETQLINDLKGIVDFCNEERFFFDKKNIKKADSSALLKQGSFPYPPGDFVVRFVYGNANHDGQAVLILDQANWNSSEVDDGIDAVLREFEASRYENAKALAARLIKSGDRKGAALYPAILSKVKPNQSISDILFYANEMHPLQRIEILCLLDGRLNDLEFRVLLNPKDLSELAKVNRGVAVRAAREIHLSILRRRRLRSEAAQPAARLTEKVAENLKNMDPRGATLR